MRNYEGGCRREELFMRKTSPHGSFVVVAEAEESRCRHHMRRTVRIRMRHASIKGFALLTRLNGCCLVRLKMKFDEHCCGLILTGKQFPSM